MNISVPRRLVIISSVLLVLALFSSASLGYAAPPPQGSGAPIQLKAATFVPTRGEIPAIAPNLLSPGYKISERGYYLVQFQGPVEQDWKDDVAALGVKILDYVPDFAFKVAMTPGQARQVEQLKSVAWVGLFHPGYKLSPVLKRQGIDLYKVRIERDTDVAAVTAELAGTGAQVVRVDGDIVWVGADSAQLDAIAKVLDVAWVENLLLPKTHNEYGAGVILGANTVQTAGYGGFATGYDGSTQTVAVADTGLGNGTAAGAHPDIPASRIASIINRPGTTDSCFKTINDDGAQDVDSGHGTHVAGSVLSDGGPAGEGKGVAPAARLVFQAIENWVVISTLCKNLYGYQDGYYLVGLPADLRQLFQQAYDGGARIHANSWGSDAAGDYTSESAYADDFIWNHRDMSITFSAGNAGADANADGIVDNDSIGSPATAKNVVTIGASENDRQGHYECDTGLTYTSHDTTYQNGQTCTTMGGQNQLGTPRQRWGFTANPIADDPTAGNKEQMAAFSSRGPTDDGRIKPDVVAPGTWILSTYSGQYQEGYGDPLNPRDNAYQSDGWGIPKSVGYKYFGGTSMSNPLAAGAAAVVRDYYSKKKSTSASAALVKATLINSAVDLLDENNDGVNDNDYPIPNNHEGWGRINLVNATDGRWFVDNSTGVSTGGNVAYQFTANGGVAKVSLVWSDYASTAAAAANLVNNLNLEVTVNGTLYRGNVFSGGWSQTAGSADTKNNVENVYLPSVAAGTSISVRIVGANVPNGPQPFAVVVAGATQQVVTAPSAPTNLTATAASNSRINLAWTDTSTNEDGFTIERCQGASCTNFAQIAQVGSNIKTYADTGLKRNTAYRYRVRAFNSGGASAYSNIANGTTPR